MVASKIRFSRTLSAFAARGDRRITDAGRRPAIFMREVAERGRHLPATARDLVLQLLAAQGIDENEVAPEMLMGDIARLGLFRAQLKTVAPKTGIPFEILKRRVEPGRMPHRVIGDALRMHGQPAHERKGSDLNDGYLATFAAYADMVRVDKRTAENSRRATRRRIEKAPSSAAILEILAGQPEPEPPGS